MRKALKGDRYKQIRFQMDSYDVLGPAGTKTLTVVLHGRLSLAGVERKIDVTAAGVRVPDGLAISGSKDLLMTDYQIKPPTHDAGRDQDQEPHHREIQRDVAEREDLMRLRMPP